MVKCLVFDTVNTTSRLHYFTPTQRKVYTSKNVNPGGSSACKIKLHLRSRERA